MPTSRAFRGLLMLAAFLLLATAFPLPASAQTSNVTITITAASSYARTAPNRDATPLVSVFQGGWYQVIGRNADSTWVLARIVGLANGGWIEVAVGQISGDLSAVPVSNTVIVPPTPGPGDPTAEPDDELTPGAVEFTTLSDLTLEMFDWDPRITGAMSYRYRYSYRFGRRVDTFSVTGDSNMDQIHFTLPLARGQVDLTNHPDLVDTYNHFAPSYTRKSLAVYEGFNSASVFNNFFTDPSACRFTETPLQCELRTSRASILFVALGTNDHLAWERFEDNYREIIEYALRIGVTPVLVTKADQLDHLDGGAPLDYVNDVIRTLAVQYHVPLMDMYAITQQLPRQGVVSDRFHLTEEAQYLRLLAALTVLDELYD